MKIEGKLLDKEGRCNHYHSKLDTINIKFKCCNTFYACIYCHNEQVNHETVQWLTTEFEEKAIHCGNCNELMMIKTYLKNTECPKCGKGFNPNCEKHHNFYFKIN